MPRNDWTDVGRSWTDGQRERILDIAAGFHWRPLAAHLSVPAAVGLARREALVQLPLPHPSHVGWSHELAPYGLFAVRANFKNGQADVYIVDHGDGCAPILAVYYAPGELSGERRDAWEQRREYRWCVSDLRVKEA